MAKCEVIAEIGWNWMGDLSLAESMIVEAAKAGADYAKFQTWSVANLKSGPWDADGRREIYEKAQLSEADHYKLIDICNQNNIKFLTSCFNKNDATFLSKLSNSIKIPSPEIGNIDLLKTIADSFEYVFLSTGAATFEEIEAAFDIFYAADTALTLLHCVSSYPCPAERINLPRIQLLLQSFTCPVGYSGHGKGISDALAALEFNISVIEKHFTTDNSLPGRDNQFAILPQDLAFLCNYIKDREAMMISHGLEYQKCEEEVRNVYRGRWEN